MTTFPFEVANYPAADVDLIYFDAGGGHRASAKALMSVAEQQHRGWQINLINLRELLEPADVIRRVTGVRVEDFYNSQLKSGLTIGTGTAAADGADADSATGAVDDQAAGASLAAVASRPRSIDDPEFQSRDSGGYSAGGRDARRAPRRRWSQFLPTWPIVRRISGLNVNRSTWFAVLPLRPSKRSRWDMHHSASFVPQA